MTTYGDSTALQAIANGTSTTVGKGPRILFIVNRCDELGVDPLDFTAEYFHRRDRKLRANPPRRCIPAASNCHPGTSTASRRTPSAAEARKCPSRQPITAPTRYGTASPLSLMLCAHGSMMTWPTQPPSQDSTTVFGATHAAR